MQLAMTVVEFDAHRQLLPNHERDQLCAWLRNLGVDWANARAMCVVQRGERYELHLTEFVPDPDTGNARWIDLALNECVTRPRVVQLGDERGWPDIHPE